MKHRLTSSFVVITVLVCAPLATARADPPTNGSPSASTGTGWTVAIASVALGGVITTVGSMVDCSRGDLECARWASLGIWSGIGVASIGSVVGLLMVRAASRSNRVQLSFTLPASRGGTSLPQATLVYSF